MSGERRKKDFFREGFKFAYFIIPDKQKATEIAREALRYLEVTCLSQDKRKYYDPVGRPIKYNDERESENSQREKHRNRVQLTEEQIFQLLICNKSCKYEEAATTDLEGSLTFYLMHSVKEVLKRNSFYAAVLNYGLLYDYDRDQTMNIYLVVNPDRYASKLPHHFDRAKETLVKQINSRFGYRIKENNRYSKVPPNLVDRFKKCLLRFNLWGRLGQSIECMLPSDFNAMNLDIKDFQFDGLHPDCNPDQEHSREYKRIHTLLDPKCHDRLVMALGYGSSEKYLHIPQFKFPKNGDRMSNSNRDNPPHLDDKELAREIEAIVEEGERRKIASIGALSIMVDGVEQARLDLNSSSHSQITIGEDAELIEIWADSGNEHLLMAVHMMTYDEEPQAGRQSIRLEGGQEIDFEINLSKNSAKIEGENLYDVRILYRETNPVRAAKLFWRQLMHRLIESMRQPISLPGERLVAMAALLVAVLAVSWLIVANLDMRNQVEKLQAERDLLLEQEQSLKQQIENERVRGDRLEKLLQERNDNQQQQSQEIASIKESQATIAAFELRPDLRIGRGNKEITESKRLTVLANTETVQLKLRLNGNDEYESYLVSIRARNKNLVEVWSKSKLRAAAGGKVVLLKIPAEILPEGDYLLMLKGADKEMEEEEIGSYSFTIVKR
jgi:hypothetical protein